MPFMKPQSPRPRRPGQESLSRADATRLLADGGQLLAVHSFEEAGREPLPGALNLPVDALCYEYRRLNKRRPVILYCTSHANCGRIASLLAG
jgi:rhodanese-related sulfurtransferase